MSEIMSGAISVLALIPSMIFSYLTMLGGRPHGRIMKRVVAPGIFTASLILMLILFHKFSWLGILSLPVYFIPLGYGGNTWQTKLQRRTIWSLVRTIASISLAITAGAWILFFLQAVISLIVTIVLGVLNPLDAPEEESLINFMSVVLVPFYII